MSGSVGCTRIDDPSAQCLVAISVGVSIAVCAFCCGFFYCILGGKRCMYRIKNCLGIVNEDDNPLPRAETAIEAADDEAASLDHCQICLDNWCGSERVQGKKITPLSPTEELAAAKAVVDGEYHRAEDIITRTIIEHRSHDKPHLPEIEEEETVTRNPHILELVGEDTAIEHHHPLHHHQTNNHSTNIRKQSVSNAQSRNGSQTYTNEAHNHAHSSLSASVSSLVSTDHSLPFSATTHHHPFSASVPVTHPPYSNHHNEELPVAHPHEHNPFHAWNDIKSTAHHEHKDKDHVLTLSTSSRRVSSSIEDHPPSHPSHHAIEHHISHTSISRHGSRQNSIIPLHHHDSNNHGNTVSLSHIDHPGTRHNSVTVSNPTHPQHTVHSHSNPGNDDHEHHHHHHHRHRAENDNLRPSSRGIE